MSKKGNTPPDTLKISYKLDTKKYEEHASQVMDCLRKQVNENIEIEALKQALMYERAKNETLQKENEILLAVNHLNLKRLKWTY